MATVFRGKIITAVAVLSTAVAVQAQTGGTRLGLIGAETQPKHLSDFPTPAAPRPVPYIQDVRNRHVFLPAPNPTPPFAQIDWPTPDPPIRTLIADAILNPNTFFLTPRAAPFAFRDWTLPAQAFPQPRGVHHRPELSPIVAPPFRVSDWVRPAAAGPQILVEPFRNGRVLPVPAGGGAPFAQIDWPGPSRVTLKPDTHLFYYIQDQTKPGFINYDWPLAPKLPSLTWDFVPNRLLFPFVAPPPPFRQADWPNASTVQIAKIGDPYNRNVFLPIPQGQPTHQLDWPRPRDPLSLQASHTVNDIPLLTRPVVNPVIRNYDWPLPARCLLLTIIWEKEGTSPIYLPTFRREWAVNSNQIVGPIAPEPETH